MRGSLSAPQAAHLHAGRELRCLLPTPLRPGTRGRATGRFVNACSHREPQAALEQRQGGPSAVRRTASGPSLPAGSLLAIVTRPGTGKHEMPRRGSRLDPLRRGGHPQFAAEDSLWYVCSRCTGEVMDSSDAVLIFFFFFFCLPGPPAANDRCPHARYSLTFRTRRRAERSARVAVGRQGNSRATRSFVTLLVTLRSSNQNRTSLVLEVHASCKTNC